MFSAFCNEETKVIPGEVGKKQPEDNAWTDHPKTPITSRDNFLAERIPAAHTSTVCTHWLCLCDRDHVRSTWVHDFSQSEQI